MNAASGYNSRVRELFASLPQGGALPDGTGVRVEGEACAADRGAWVRFEARLVAGSIADCRFRAWGCPHTLAASALAAQSVIGVAAGQGPATDAAQLAAELGVPREKFGRLLVVEDALAALLNAARRVQ